MPLMECLPKLPQCIASPVVQDPGSTSFLLGVFMYLRYRIWLKAIIFLVACFLLAGVPAPFFWLYAGIAFNYDLYLQKVKNKGLW